MSGSLDALLRDPSPLIEAPCETCCARLPADALFPLSGNKVQDTVEADEACVWRRFITRDGCSVEDENALIVVCPSCDSTAVGKLALTPLNQIELPG
jgi:hypothetical protein